MGSRRFQKRKLRRATFCLLVLLGVLGCSGITPDPPRNHREEGPERGIFTGSKGEVVIPMPHELLRKDEAEKMDRKGTPARE